MPTDEPDATIMVNVKVTNTETGDLLEEKTTELEDYMVLTKPPFYVAHTNSYPTSGTTQLTIKRETPE